MEREEDRSRLSKINVVESNDDEKNLRILKC